MENDPQENKENEGQAGGVPIPSPYIHPMGREGHAMPVPEDAKAFMEEIKTVCDKYHNHNFMITYQKENSKMWIAFSSMLDETLVRHLELISRAMRETWEKLQQSKK